MNRLLSIALTFAVAVLVAGLQPASATILTFGGDFGVGDGTGIEPFPGAYGDNVDSVGDATWAYEEGNGWTPNVVIDYVGRIEYFRYPATPWYGAGVAKCSDPPGPWEFVLTPDAGYGVKVNSFELGTITSPYNATWTVLDGASILATGTVAVSTTETSVNTGLTGFYAGPVTVKIESSGSWLGLSDLNFDQQIPEPSMLVLLSTGLIGLLCYAWRKRR